MTDQTFVSLVEQNGATEQGQLSAQRSALIGGLGALVPVVVTLGFGGWDNLMSEGSSGAYLLGFGLKIAGLFAMGALMVWLSRDTRRTFAAFRMGITAPALLVGMLQSPAFQNMGTGDEAQSARAGYLNSPVVSVASHVYTRDLVFGSEDCTVLDGLIGRKCK